MRRAFLAHDLFRKPVLAFRDHALAAGRYLVLLVADMLHPGDVFAVERLLRRDMDHAGRRRRAMPMFLIRRNPDDVTGFDHPYRATPALHAAGAGDHEKRLAERMRVPRRPRPRLEAHQSRTHTRRRRRFDDRLLPDRAGEALDWSTTRRPRTAGVNVHDTVSSAMRPSPPKSIRSRLRIVEISAQCWTEFAISDHIGALQQDAFRRMIRQRSSRDARLRIRP